MTHDTLARLDALIDKGACHSIFIGKSAVPGAARFVTLRTGQGVTVSTGAGATTAAALDDALSKLSAPPTPAMPGMPGMTRPAMPGVTR